MRFRSVPSATQCAQFQMETPLTCWTCRRRVHPSRCTTHRRRVRYILCVSTVNSVLNSVLNSVCHVGDAAGAADMLDADGNSLDLPLARNRHVQHAYKDRDGKPSREPSTRCCVLHARRVWCNTFWWCCWCGRLGTAVHKVREALMGLLVQNYTPHIVK